jgi:SAM-dependent methyltransferase
MDRATWLRDRREAVRADYDRDAPTYDDHPYPTSLHGTFVDRLIASTPPGGTILDAPCGTGRYFARIRAAGRHVVGIDQSAGMLRIAEARGLADELQQVGLQELPFEDRFDAAMTVDAMEHVPPDDWPLVLGNLARAVVRGGWLYLTVEEVDDARLDKADQAAREHGWPALRGEVIEDDTGGYHAYNSRDRVRGWLADLQLEPIAEDTDRHDGWAYWHLLVHT